MKASTALLLQLLLLLTVGRYTNGEGEQGDEGANEEGVDEDEEDEEGAEEDEPPRGPPLQPMCDLVALYGYKCKEHQVKTRDGYLLSLYQIPPAGKPTGKAVLLVHGLFMSAEIFAIFNNSLGYQLADEGHDVWLAATRGTIHGRNHSILNPDIDEKFWDFSWEDIGAEDIVRQVEYVSGLGGRRELHYVGHSLGATAFLIAAGRAPHSTANLTTVTLMAPVYYYTKYQFMLKEGSSMYNMAIDTMKNFEENKKWEAFPRPDVVKNDHQINCEDLPSMAITYCNMGMGMVKQRVGDFMPTGTSRKNLAHLQQNVISGKSLFYDYGEEQNKKVYKQSTPPMLDLKSIKNQINVFYCESDHLAAPQDIEALLKEITVQTKHHIEDENFNHMDFIFPTSEENEKHYEEVIQKLKHIFKHSENK